MSRIFIPAAVLLLTLCACKRHSESALPEKHYSLSGKIIALNAKNQTATVDAAAVPGFMDAMTMEYPIKSKAEFGALQVGDKINASVDVQDDGLYSLSHIQKQNSNPSR